MNFIREMIAALAAAALFCPPVFSDGLNASLVTSGCAQLDCGNYTRAISLFAAALRKQPDDLEARRLLVRAFICADREKEALQQLQAIRQVASGNSGDSVMMAEACYHMGDARSAIACYKEALILEPSSAPAKIGLARALIFTGNLRGAVAVCNDALRFTQAVQSRQQFLELLSNIRMQATIVHKQLSG